VCLLQGRLQLRTNNYATKYFYIGEVTATGTAACFRMETSAVVIVAFHAAC
jgi:hypothetical protein